MSKDTAKQPVESLEDEISSVIDAAGDDDEKEQPEDVEAEQESISDEIKEDATDADEDEDAGDDAEPEDDGSGELAASDSEASDGAEAEDDLAESEGTEDLLEPPEHWSASDKETFGDVPKAAQEFILKRHKEMEGDYTRKSQEIADTKRQYDAVRDALAPYEQEFASAGLDHAGAVRKLAAVHHGLKTDGKSTILALAQTYGIDLNEDDQEYADPATRQVQSQLTATEQRLARIEQEAQQTQQQAIFDTIRQFETATDANGKLLHPHFKELEPEMTRLIGSRAATDLDDAYRKVLAWRTDLAPVKTGISKVSREEKVKKAKKAATGIRSSGAVGKPKAGALSLEDEIASLIP